MPNPVRQVFFLPQWERSELHKCYAATSTPSANATASYSYGDVHVSGVRSGPLGRTEPASGARLPASGNRCSIVQQFFSACSSKIFVFNRLRSLGSLSMRK